MAYEQEIFMVCDELAKTLREKTPKYIQQDKIENQIIFIFNIVVNFFGNTVISLSPDEVNAFKSNFNSLKDNLNMWFLHAVTQFEKEKNLH